MPEVQCVAIHRDIDRIAIECAKIDIVAETLIQCKADLVRAVEEMGLVLEDELIIRQFKRRYDPDYQWGDEPDQRGAWVSATDEDYTELRVEVEGTAVEPK